MGGYFNVIAAWLDGESTSGLELFGRTMFWWGRAGKLMLFLAGLAIALDLINPARLRARGRAAMDRSQAYLARSRLYRDRSRMIALRRAIQRDIYSLQPMSDHYVTYPNLAISWPPGAVPRRLAMPLPAYREFYRETVGALRREHACPTQHLHVCWEQVAFANHRVESSAPTSTCSPRDTRSTLIWNSPRHHDRNRGELVVLLCRT